MMPHAHSLSLARACASAATAFALFAFLVLLALPTARADAATASVFGAADGPLDGAVHDVPTELGMKFTTDTGGYITAVKFYKQTGNDGTHVGHLWKADGTLLSTVTFSNETASGWQTATLPVPVQVSANTTYVVSYYSPTGYFAFSPGGLNSGYDSPPLHAPAGGLAGGNGVYNSGSSGFPSSSWNSTNYWVDVVWSDTPGGDTRPPQVASTSPSANATDVPLTSKVTATFDEPVDPLSVNAGSIVLKDGDGTSVVSSVSYDQATRTATLTPTSQLQLGATYTATVRTGNGGVVDLAGNQIAADVSWSFSTAAKCPCSVFKATDGPSGAAVQDSPIELGMKVRSGEDGYITALRFYKQDNNKGSHIAHLWSESGQLLATAPYASETDSGWQEVELPNPVAITKDTTYVVSYFSPGGFLPFSAGDLNTRVGAGPLYAPAASTVGGNGVFAYGGGFPSTSFNNANYWVDAVFDRTTPPDTRGPDITSLTPADNGSDAPVTTTVKATFDEQLAPSSVTSSTVSVKDGSGASVAGSVSYDSQARAAVFTPTGQLSNDVEYTATLKGGAGGITDVSGNPLAATRDWTFRTVNKPLDQGAGGPILLVTNPSDAFSTYYAEILRSEGITSFSTKAAPITAGDLTGKDLVLYAATSTATDVTTLTNFVQGGGRLIAMKPDKNLAPLLGLTDASATLSNAYMKVDTSSAAGAGIDGQTLQFHGTADKYALNGATALASLYSDAATATANPAVSLRAVGGAGGQAAAFTYNLAKSVVYTRQGNPAWAGQKRDGTINGSRPDDLFYGAKAGDVQPDWVDPNRIAVPQADEQQRLLANLIEQLELSRQPLPRFNYLPKGKKAALVLTGDDHSIGGVKPYFQRMEQMSKPGCSVVDWECVRASAYMYPGTPITPGEAKAFQDEGFEIGLHPTTGCQDFTDDSLDEDLSAQLGALSAAQPLLKPPVSSRTHCIVWSNWAGAAKVERKHGIRYDTNYYYLGPGGWLKQPGLMTGSGFPQRFADSDGTMLDIYQAMTQVTDESDMPVASQFHTLLDNALGSKAYYGAFTVNMHTDYGDQDNANNLVDEAQQRGVPVVSSKQMLDWTDGRNASSVTNLATSGNTVTFAVSADSRARGLQGMIPASSASGPILKITRGGQPVSYDKSTIKGITYATFNATSGNYVATYASDTTSPSVTGITATADGQGHATVSWSTDEPSTSVVQYGRSAALGKAATETAPVTDHVVELSGLAPATTYNYRITSTDIAGNGTDSPSSSGTLTFTTPNGTLVDSRTNEFAAGAQASTLGGGTLDTSDGEVQLQPAVGDEFDGTSLNASLWTSNAWASGGGAVVAGGQLSADATVVAGTSFTGEPAALEFTATFPAVSNESIGFGNDLTDYPMATFTTENEGSTDGQRLTAWTGADAEHDQQTELPAGIKLDVPHRFKIVWGAGNVTYYVDGTQVAQHAIAIQVPMRPVVADAELFGASTRVHWLREGPYASTGTFTSRVLDSSPNGGDWTTLVPTVDLPAATSIAYDTRSGSTPTPDASWSSWQAVSGTTIASPTARYLQYRARMTGTGAATPTLKRVDVSYGASADAAPVPGTVSVSPSSPTTNQTVTASVSGFSDPNGDPLTYHWQWYKNGTAIPGATSASLNLALAGNGDRADKIRAEAYATDGKGAASDPVGATVTVANTAPVAGTASIAPSPMSTNDVAKAVPSGFTDIDGDTLTYTYQWYKNGTAIPGATGRTLDLSVAGNGDFFDQISVDIKASDGNGGTSAAARGTQRIVGSNASPVVGTVAITPTSPKTDQTLTATPSGFRDPDNDALTYTYQWSVNGTAISGATGSTFNLATAGNGDRGDKVGVRVIAKDTHNATSDPATDEETVINSAPTAGTVSIKPSAPAAGETIAAGASGFADADGDAISYTYQWYKNGVAISGATGRSLDLSQPGNGSVGDTIAVDVTAIDGKGGSTAAVRGSDTISSATAHPVAAFGFEEAAGTIAADQGGADDGTIVGATRVDNGKFGRALDFDGKADEVKVPDSAGLDLSTAMTLEAWVKPAAVTDWRAVVFKERNGGLGYGLYSDGDGQAPAAHAYDAATEQDTAAVAGHGLPTNEWSHLASTYDGTRLRLYVNGTQVASKPMSGPIVSGEGQLTIGGNDLWTEWFKGLIDEVRVYNRALTGSDIQSDMTKPVIPNTPAPPSDTSPAAIGQFGQTMQWPIVAVHASVTADGDVVAWDGFGNAPNSERKWSPATGTMIRVANGLNLFCSGHVELVDGKLLVVGGHISSYEGLKTTNIFNPFDDTWTRGADMSVKRWYPTAVELPDGRVFVASGDDIDLDSPGYSIPLTTASNTLPSIYDPKKDEWTDMPNASRRMPLYPFLFVLPNGKIFDAGPDTTTRTFDVSTGQWSVVGTSPIDGQSAVMYRPGKILKSGTWSDPEFPDRPVTNGAATIDMTAANPAWKSVSRMKYPRSYHTLTALPDGKVLATGGQDGTDGVNERTGILAAEMWDPDTDKWSVMDSGSRPRLYHSTSLLLPDGRVLLAGGGAYGEAQDEKSAELYSPPYLFKGPRPQVTSAPSTINYNSQFTVNTPDASSISSVSMIKLGSVTHDINMDQRFIPLTKTNGTGKVTVDAPANSNLAPPGYYMVFLVNGNGVPSMGQIVQIKPSATDTAAPSAPANLTATPQSDGTHLSWSASTDNVGVVEYRVYRSSNPSFKPSAANRIARVLSGTTFTDSGVPNGKSYYRVMAADAAGNLSPASSQVSVTIGGDTTAPTVELETPVEGATVTGVQHLTAVASDENAMATVQYKVDGASIGSPSADPDSNYDVTWDARAVPDGAHTITAVATDASGNTKTSAPVHVTVKNASASIGLVAAYGFEEASGSTASDSAGTNTGSIVGATRAPTGKFGKALTFDGASSSVSVPNATALNPGAGGFTVESWVDPTQLGGWRTVVAKDAGSALAYSLYAGSDVDLPSAGLFTDADIKLAGTAALPLNDWSHLAMTWDAETQTLRLYVDGILVNSRYAPGPIAPSTGPLRIGGNGVLGEWFKGMIDEVRVYNRPLSLGEIQTDMITPVKP